MPALIGWPGVVEYCQVSLNIEDVVDGGMGGEKSLDTKARQPVGPSDIRERRW
jgi:hypothetical protein